MGLTKYRLGDLIEQRREKNDNYNVPIRGVSRDGFINAKQKNADTKLYNTFYLYDFVFNPARMEINSIALNTEYEKAICSSLYEVFYIKNYDVVLPEYLNMFIKRNEFSRMCEYIGWGSAREYCRVSNISELEIELPSIEIQQKYVEIYRAMKLNQQSYETGLENLKLTCDAYIDKVRNTATKELMSTLLEEIDIRNTDVKITDVQGININKNFMPSIASLESTDLSKYKVINKNQFAYSPMQTGRDECIRIALYNKNDNAIISPAYSVLQVKNEIVLAEWIMLWFSRKESDRYGWFKSDSSIRASLELSTFYEIKIPIPKIEIQQAIVDIYTAYQNRKEINERLKLQIKDICPILIKGALEEGAKS